MLPPDFPPYSTVYYYFRRWQKRGVWQKMNQALRQQVRQQVGKKVLPTVAIVDSQSVKTREKREPARCGGPPRCRDWRGKCTALMVANWSKDANGTL